MNLEFFYFVLAYLLGIICSSYLIYFYKKEISVLEKNLHAKIHENEKLNEELRKFQQNPSHDCQLLLKEILSSTALVKIEVVDSSDLFMWKPGKR